MLLVLLGALITKFSHIALQANSGAEIGKACSYCKNKPMLKQHFLSC